MGKLFAVIIMCAAITLSGLWSRAWSSGESEKADSKQLFESKCSICHSINRPKSKKKSKQGWKTTVMRMKNKNGCPINDEEAKMIIDYLAEKYGT